MKIFLLTTGLGWSLFSITMNIQPSNNNQKILQEIKSEIINNNSHDKNSIQLWQSLPDEKLEESLNFKHFESFTALYLTNPYKYNV